LAATFLGTSRKRRLRGGGGDQIFSSAVANEGHGLGVALGSRSELLVVATQLTARFPANALIEQFQHQKLCLLMLAAIAMGEVRAAKVLKIWHNQSQHTTRLENAQAFTQKGWNLTAGDVL
jgi:hypothetical protein